MNSLYSNLLLKCPPEVQKFNNFWLIQNKYILKNLNLDQLLFAFFPQGAILSCSHLHFYFLSVAGKMQAARLAEAFF